MPIAYLYERWSTEAQTEGDSGRRQLAAAERYVAQHPGLTLDRSRWRDAGVSAFRSANLKDGALGAFVRAVESKKIAKGSCLLIENLDRLSRAAPLVALNSLQRLLSLGIVVVTLHDSKRYDAHPAHTIRATRAVPYRQLWRHLGMRSGSRSEPRADIPHAQL